MEDPRINESELSDETMDFISKFRVIDQDKYDELANEVSKRPITISKAKQIIS